MTEGGLNPSIYSLVPNPPLRILPLDPQSEGVYTEPMTSTWQDSLREAQATLESRYDELTQELEQVQKALEGIKGVLSGNNDGNQRIQGVAPVSPVVARREAPASTPGPNGSPRRLTRRQAILQIIPEFEGSTFAPRDVRKRYIELYPQENNKNLAPTLSGLLKDMAQRGEIERVGRGEKATDPTIYRAKENNEESLLKSGP